VPKDYVNCCGVYKKGAITVQTEIYVCLIIYTEHMQKIIPRPLNAAHESVLDEAWNGCGEGQTCRDCMFIIRQLTEERREFEFFG
jgi:hypothetical protein